MSIFGADYEYRETLEITDDLDMNENRIKELKNSQDAFDAVNKRYRRLSLSQSPGDQTKYFELSVVWDSQFVTLFTLNM